MAQPQGNPKQIDQNSIPPAVRRAAEEADRLQREAIERQQAENGGPSPGGEPAPVEPATPPAPTNPEPETPRQEGTPPREERREEKRAEPPADPNDESWKHRFESERGRTEKLRQDVSTLSGELSNLRGLLATMQAAPPAQAPSNEMRFEKLITKEEEETWGPEFMTVVEKKAKELIAPLEAKLNQRLEQLDGTVRQTTEVHKVNAHQAMIRDLDGHPRIGRTWREINEFDDFVEWLQYPDSLSGQKRHDMLKQAWSSNDASRVAAFFENFLREAAVVAPQPQPSNGSAPAAKPKPSLEQFAAPGRAHTATPAPGAQAEKPIITRADIARFYADRQAGRFKGREKEADAYERDIFDAQREGRIQ